MTKAEDQFIKKYDALGRALIKEYGLELAKEVMKKHYFGQYESKEDFDKHWEGVPLKSFTNSLIAVEVGNKIHVFHAFKQEEHTMKTYIINWFNNGEFVMTDTKCFKDYESAKIYAEYKNPLTPTELSNNYANSYHIVETYLND